MCAFMEADYIAVVVCCRCLVGALLTDCWLSVDGAQKLGLQVMSCLGQQLYDIWSAFYYGTASVLLGNHNVQSPWARAAGPDTAAPCSIFLSLPLQAYLAPAHDALMVSRRARNGSQHATWTALTLPPCKWHPCHKALSYGFPTDAGVLLLVAVCRLQPTWDHPS